MRNCRLVLADIHENGGSLLRLLDTAKKNCPTIQEIWLLGDLFGHADQSVGTNDFSADFLKALEKLADYPLRSVFGNWEYWLFHPEQDDTNPAQGAFRDQLNQRRERLRGALPKGFEGMLDRMTLALPEADPQFTLFHGCSYACHNGSEYQAAPWESYLNPKDLNIVTRGLFENQAHLGTPHFFFAHTHIPGYFAYATTSLINIWMQYNDTLSNRVLPYENGIQRFGINPGTAGIRQDGFPGTAVLLDTDERTFQFIADSE